MLDSAIERLDKVHLAPAVVPVKYRHSWFA
jgi:hypothetical protein